MCIRDRCSFVPNKGAGRTRKGEEYELGVRCVAASIKHGEQQQQYAFSISAPIHRMDEKRMKEIAEYALAMKKINL